MRARRGLLLLRRSLLALGDMHVIVIIPTESAVWLPYFAVKIMPDFYCQCIIILNCLFIFDNFIDFCMPEPGKPRRKNGVPSTPYKQAAKDAAAKLACSEGAQAAVRRMVQQMKKNRDFSLEQARDLVIAFAESGDFDLLVKLVTARLPYEHARKEPEPPAPTGVVSDEPEPMSEEEFCERHGVDRG